MGDGQRQAGTRLRMPEIISSASVATMPGRYCVQRNRRGDCRTPARSGPSQRIKSCLHKGRLHGRNRDGIRPDRPADAEKDARDARSEGAGLVAYEACQVGGDDLQRVLEPAHDGATAARCVQYHGLYEQEPLDE
jgi:hypothetical protein